MKKIKLCCLWVCLSTSLYAQIPSNTLGLNPLSLRWNQIETDRVQVIFPEGLESQGNRVANTVHYLWDHANPGIGEMKQRVTILLQNQTTIPNGFVTVGPFRSEFLMTPPQFNNGTTDWLDLLSIHEYQHVKQFSNSRRGITKAARAVFGSWMWGGFAGTALPRWFFEGDAVGMETALTQAGRGRLPAFDMEYRALVLNDRIYGYEKASAGSLKDFVPDHYSLGYYLTTYGRRHFGREIWSGVVADAVKYKGVFFPFSRSLKRRAGVRTPELYRATMEELDSLWTEKYEDLDITPSRLVNTKRKTTVTDYQNPQYLDEETLIVQKSSFEQIRAFYQIDQNGQEKRLTNRGNYSTDNLTLSVANGILCWSEWGFDPRWRNQDFSIIKTYNTNFEDKNKVTSRTRYFSPALSSDGGRIVAVEVDPNLNYQLVILNALDGQKIKTLANPENHFLSFPRWTDNDQHIVVVAREGQENWLQTVHTEDAKVTEITRRTTHLITRPFARGEYAYFSGAHTGINNIFATKLEGDLDIYQVTSAKLGAFQPAVSPSGQKLAFSDFTVNGYDLREMELKPESWKKYDENQPSSITYYQPLVEQEGGSIVEEDIPQADFKVSRFNKFSGLINPHSIVPVLFPPIFGARLLSDNKFSTLSGALGVTYNSNESEFSYSALLTYAELYPVVRVGFNRSNRERTFNNFFQSSDTTVQLMLYEENWRENDFFVGLELPLNLGQNTLFRSLNLSADFHVLNLNTDNNFENEDNPSVDLVVENPAGLSPFFTNLLGNTTLNALDVRLRFNSQQTFAQKNVNPRFAHFWDIRYRTTLGGGDIAGDVFSARLDLFLPGLARNHSLFFNLAYQQEDFDDNYKFANFFFYPRGYGSFIHDRIYKVGVNYAFPIWFPDIAIGPLLFIKRIKANVFFDFGQFQRNLLNDVYTTENVNIRSTGLELTFDIRAFRLLEADLGVRYSYLLDDFGENNVFDFLLFRIGI